MEKRSLLMEALAEENKKISDALMAVGYETVKIDLIQIRNAETDSVDIKIWAKSEERG